jgi:hypothetical protein
MGCKQPADLQTNKNHELNILASAHGWDTDRLVAREFTTYLTQAADGKQKFFT